MSEFKTAKYAAVILAAGMSSRMERFKPLLPLGNQTIADRVISLFADLGIEVCLVTGWRKDELLTGIKTKDIKSAENPDFHKGMLSSVQTGLRCLQKAGYQAFFILPVDIPLVHPSTITKMLSGYEAHPGKIVYPVFDKQRGHPVLVPASFIPAILEAKADTNLRNLLEVHESLSVEVPVPDENILFDADTPNDYDELLRRLANYT